MAINTTLKANTDDIRSQAARIEDTVLKIERCLQSLTQIHSGTSTYWRGDAADKHRKVMSDQAQEFQRIMERLKAYHTDILNMAGIYDKAVEANIQVVRQLKPEVDLV